MQESYATELKLLHSLENTLQRWFDFSHCLSDVPMRMISPSQICK
jgi:hypothetical protein